MYDVTVAYRVYPGFGNQDTLPLGYASSKWELFSRCLHSFHASVQGLNVRMIAILDSCPESYGELFLELFGGEHVELVPGEAMGNRGSFARQIDALLQQSSSEAVYFAEDDYLYRPKAFSAMLEFLYSASDVHFATPYDHADYYYPIHLHKHAYPIRANAGLHWRQAVYTCCTFLTRQTTLQHTHRVFEAYCRGLMDNSLWMALTKYNIRNPYRLMKYLIRDREFLFPTLANAYRYCPWQSLFGKTYKLWAPMPSIATHLHKKFLAPNVDWSHYWKALEPSTSQSAT